MKCSPPGVVQIQYRELGQPFRRHPSFQNHSSKSLVLIASSVINENVVEESCLACSVR